ncbi:MAG: hypothetical protein IPI73_24595 [Betaproteobacteria bacterium]|nr:hypothetical protein [Betaproteobacteria bacterium]
MKSFSKFSTNSTTLHHMNQTQPTEDSILLRGREIRVVSCSLPQAELRFYPENPRIYSSVWTSDGVEPSQEEIFRALSRSEHVRETLVPSITNNGGLIEPVLVRNNVVLEGNSRLAAYRLLVQTDSRKWSHIRAKVLPSDITDSEVFSLLGEYHMVGKKDWQPFEQAGYLYRRFKTHAVPEDSSTKEVGLSLSKIRHFIRVYDFMVKHNDRSPERWSYYDELLRGSDLILPVSFFRNLTNSSHKKSPRRRLNVPSTCAISFRKS